MGTLLRPALACLVAALLAAGCASTPPVPVAAPVGEVSHPAVAIVARLEGGGAATVPDVVGRDREDALALLAPTGAAVQVVAFSDGQRISAQYPEAGGLAADGHVTLWIGEPPAPPPPPPPAPDPPAAPAPPPAPAAGPSAEVTPAPADAPGVPAPSPTATPSPSPPAPSKPGTWAVGTRLDGKASWYGPGFAGRTTACGSRFDPSALTLASRELPCGTVVRVSGPGGTSVVSTVTDWGPLEWTGRRFDLSAATFEALAPLGRGVIPVTVEILEAS